jgi:serine/threonine protein kinase
MPKNNSLQHPSAKGKDRPAFLRALGKNDPPAVLTFDGAEFERCEIFKHDSWAATALYRSGDRQVVCKLNRQAPIFVIPMTWLGRWLARREAGFLNSLSDVPGIPKAYRVHTIDGKLLKNGCAHDFVAGQPMSLKSELPVGFFDKLDKLLHELHARHIAYIDLHKQENVIVGDDGSPYLIDFQISARLPKLWGFRSLFKILADSDCYHVEKHRRRRQGSNAGLANVQRPWWIRCHRMVAVPFRTMRRKFLVMIGVRKGNGCASTEIATEIGLRQA